MSMGVYIKDMEMPKNCDECPLYTCMHNHDDCPLVPVPPHVINFDKPYSFTISWDGEQLKGNIIGTAI